MKALLVSLLLLISTPTLANAHKWYESDCCSNNDCFVIDSKDVKQDHEGNYWYKQFKFSSNQVRNSKDSDFHACIQYMKHPGREVPRCLYISYIQ